MTPYRFTSSAHEDLVDIWLYTQETWGEAQADLYQDALHRCCERIASGEVKARSLPGLERVRLHRCQHHVLFFVEQDQAVVIVAVLHERMNLIERLRERL
ncbi:type II toxin-antitoxin system RelE/ParE family toxin [Acuticoccus sediminis]|uniref:type II toxin-antitoxin system RelE/ParE family toxin n=1 Tax=Acuticoccus sediminis TaxID=2184697 RepID=UPI001CFC6610|nr:type II toxin-antitoxin system RelE/ParE family toxin [Acuticoccus sediminis]